MNELLLIGSTDRFTESTANVAARSLRQKTNSNLFYDTIFQSMKATMDTNDATPETDDFASLCSVSFARHFGAYARKTYYHVLDAASIAQQNWCHEDFPFDKFFTNSVDDSALDWKPTRANPSQLAPDIQAKISGTLGKHAIVVPPALDEKMKHDPVLREKVAKNIDQTYAFHVGAGPRLPLPGTKFYGTRVYSSVVILNEDGEVEHCRVSSGGGMIGPDEETLRQIEREQNRKAKRKAENERLNAETAAKYWEECRTLPENTAASATTYSLR